MSTATTITNPAAAPSPLIGLNSIRSVVQEYLNKMLDSIQGMKVLVLDKETTGMVSMVYSQSDILQKEVFLFEKIDSGNKEQMPHMKAVYFVRPTQDNFNYICEELSTPKYSDYHLFFTNFVGSTALEQMAKADSKDLVREIQEYYSDFYPVNPDTFTLNITGVLSKRTVGWQANGSRIIDGIVSALLALKKKPIIRYSANSELTKTVAEAVARSMQTERELFEMRKSEPILLILDRKDDPVTPLLHQWTYQSMIHELLGIRNNRVNLNQPGVKEDPAKEVVLSIDHDTFFKDNLYMNYGDLGASIKDLVETYQKKMDSNANIKTIEDMKKFIENFPNFQKFSTNVSKHVNMMEEISKKISGHHLMEISEVQQELACGNEHSAAYQRICEIIDDQKYTDEDKLVLVMLYSIRYEDGRVRDLQDRLVRAGMPQQLIGLLLTLRDLASKNQREGDLFGTKNILKFMNGVVKRGLQGVSNIYTQHVPLLNEILELLIRNKLQEKSYPYFIPPTAQQLRERVTDIIVFVVGGITYEEAYNVHKFNVANANAKIRVVLGGTTILNRDQFLEDLGSLRMQQTGIGGNSNSRK
ncbi:hypothetical protein SAMD00019534_075190 [Acytostelium subglobosum LB1]|uniref:hypothetical protein n=1 Tax=Acytostelium subglobosum LB1 TaxID=1410327 RepID=UPI000644F144|nr:hypothetical protein SAMD00019534_075190 [Acytostelium subglobosum LB1]GAM24344.1 hypothetical protein SAMD00019534_075190 [Acytostelium subglobosum LB1]|eukprot:XP_012752670.1 hypothetical protein SAMD00019534_075190 [Acytostelium subglobosum LB1]